jgi:tetratricopeptide (TPR) repeat protein
MFKSIYENNCASLLLIVFIIILSYSNSLNASWHLDDYPNIVLNERIHLQEINATTIFQTFFASPSGTFYRPLPMLSFAVNWYLHGVDVFGYHVVNLTIHCMNSILLYLCILGLLQFPVFNNRFSNRQAHLISFIATLLWSLNPIQTQSVTYIVQRMTAMAAMFYLGSLLLYVWSKRASVLWKRMLFIVLSLISFILATLSKENVILLPLSIIALELIFFDSLAGASQSRKQQFIIYVVSMSVILVLLIWFFFDWQNPLDKLNSIYEQRSFSPLQRLMTQARVLVHYLTLLFFPLPQRLSLCYDFAVSTTLLSPPATLVCILLQIALIAFCILKYKTRRIFAFSILFFYINHLVESTILPLELVFEHRNYLPSMFLFLPITVWVVEKKAEWSRINPKYNTIAMAGVWLLFGILANWTFSRNLVWSDEKTLWEYEISKNPALARPYHNLAWGHYQANGRYAEALELYKKALTLKAASKIERARTTNNIGRVYYLLADYENALHAFSSVIELDENMNLAVFQKAMTLIQMARWQQASELIDYLIANNYSYPDPNRLKGMVRMHQGRATDALRCFEASLQHAPSSLDTIVHLSMALARTGKYEQGSKLLQSLGDGNDSIHPLVLIGLAEISRLKGDEGSMHHYLNRFLGSRSTSETADLLEKWSRDKTMPMIDYRYHADIIGKN